MVPEIIAKLRKELDLGITTEAQVVYLLAAVRKIIEQEGTAQQYEYLKFHADWALHFALRGTFAQKILSAFNSAHPHFKAGVNLADLPAALRNEISGISAMDRFSNELKEFLCAHGLPSIEYPRSWTHFLHLYAQVIKDCPLVVRAHGVDSLIKQVTVRAQVADQQMHGEVYYKIAWRIEDHNGEVGEFFVINSFSERPEYI